jgi:ABC-2 type transport system permease protein
MIVDIAKKEFKEAWRDKRFIISALFLSFLIIISLFLGYKGFKDYEDIKKHADVSQREQWLNKGEMNPHSATHHGLYLFKPLTSLSFFDKGIDDYVGNVVFLESHKQNNSKYKPAEEKTQISRFREVTGAFIFQILIPLLIIVLIYNSVSGERESGTLRQIMSLGINKSTFITGKILGNTIALSLVLVPVTIIAVIFSLIANKGLFTDLPLRLLTLIIMYSIYFTTFVFLSFGISALSESSKKSLISLVSFWFITCLIVPPTISNITKFYINTPSETDFYKKIEEKKLKYPSWEDRMELVKKENLAKYKVSTIEELPINVEGIVLMQEEEIDTKLYKEAFEELYDTYKQQNNFYQYIGIISPLTYIQNASMLLCGTDLEHYIDFRNVSEKYRANLVFLMNENIKNNPKKSSFDFVAGKELWEKVPEFKYTYPQVNDLFGSVLPSIVNSILWLIFSFIFMIFSISKLKVF